MTERFDTRLVHGGVDKPPARGDGAVPAIEMSTTFVRADPRDDNDLVYCRTNNPNRRLLERRIASLENAHDAVAFATGAAASLAMFQALPEQSHIIATADAYFGTIVQLNDLARGMGHQVSAVDTTSQNNITDNWQPNTRLVWLETPSNPQMNISDIAATVALAHERGAMVCCDNTLATSVLQQPLAHGADFSMHSSTKFFGGHSDVMGGVVIAREAGATLDRLRHIQNIGGATPAPFDCWLLLRSLATLGLRVRHQSANAAYLAQALSSHPSIERVLYAGDLKHPGRAVADKQMSGGGALLSLLVKGNAEDAIGIAKRTRIFKQATSLGGVESLIEHRFSVEGEHSVSPENLLRLSVGVEDVDDLLQDLKQAIDAL
ncbi:MAG: PLP-dependent aspartate aminotransferase family protein [Gammaproteobacteria bacterium]